MGKIIPALAFAALTVLVTAQEQEAPEAGVAGPEAVPARYALQDIDGYIESTAGRLAIQDREVDPFGLPQDPSVEPVKPTIEERFASAPAAPQTAFVDIVNSIEVTAVMPAQKRFLVGSRMIKEGDVFPLLVEGRSIRVRVASVGGQQILFQNMEDGTTAPLRAKLMPPGMSPNQNGIRVPGMQPNSSTAPLPIDLGAPNR